MFLRVSHRLRAHVSFIASDGPRQVDKTDRQKPTTRTDCKCSDDAFPTFRLATSYGLHKSRSHVCDLNHSQPMSVEAYIRQPRIYATICTRVSVCAGNAKTSPTKNTHTRVRHLQQPLITEHTKNNKLTKQTESIEHGEPIDKETQSPSANRNPCWAYKVCMLFDRRNRSVYLGMG